MKGEYGQEDFQSEHVIHIGGVAALPFGRDRRWMNQGRLVDAVIGGWKLSGIFTYQSGQPVNVACTTSHAAGIGCYAITDRSQIFSNAHTLTHWLNAAAYTDPTANASTPNVTDFSPFGSRPANGFGPSFHRGDISLQKAFNLTAEKANIIEIRGDAFNVTNTPNFGQPGSLTPSNGSFASITSERDSREFQFSVRYIFGRGGQQ
jgi:hypothetical protein